MKKELNNKLWKSSNAFKRVFFEKDENGLAQLTEKGVIASLLIIIGLLVLCGWMLGGL